jgi:RNA recognition motif-containing protein
MGRSNHSAGKRQREMEKARKKSEKADRRQRRRDEGGEGGESEFELAPAPANDPSPSVEELMAAISTPSGTREAATPPCRLFLGGLSWSTTVATLREACEEFGPVSDAVIVTDRNTGESKGFGFVTMENRKHAARAIEVLHESELDGRRILVKVATDRDR